MMRTVKTSLFAAVLIVGAVLFGLSSVQALPTIQSEATLLYGTTAQVDSACAKTTGGYLWGVFGYNASGSSQFIQLFDTASVPADGAVPKISFTVAATSNFSLDLSGLAVAFKTGICWSNSSTQATKTIGSADVWMNIQFK